ELLVIADYVTETRMIKHPFEKGTKARKGIEF
ncbi:MAG: cob(I)yrinic acid a,c-diamide adenosyltransferase, partial [Nitrospirae bacterium]|nr:cob(I)yrinic acid a,c-diamide adenosyltransferase [Nitrospirota bacterium]